MKSHWLLCGALTQFFEPFLTPLYSFPPYLASISVQTSGTEHVSGVVNAGYVLVHPTALFARVDFHFSIPQLFSLGPLVFRISKSTHLRIIFFSISNSILKLTFPNAEKTLGKVFLLDKR